MDHKEIVVEPQGAEGKPAHEPKYGPPRNPPITIPESGPYKENKDRERSKSGWGKVCMMIAALILAIPCFAVFIYIAAKSSAKSRTKGSFRNNE